MRYHALLAAGGLAVLAGCASNPKLEAAGDVAPATPATGRYMPSGSSLDVRLDQTLNASRNNGDSFSATVVNPLIAQDGAIVVPAGAQVFGHVTGVSKASIPGQQSVIRLDFDNLQTNGRTYPFDASVTNVDVGDQSSSSNGSLAKGAVTGGAAGAVLGAILGGGDLSNLIEGGLLGAAAGTAISLGKDSMHSEIPAGTTMTLRATHDVQLR